MTGINIYEAGSGKMREAQRCRRDRSVSHLEARSEKNMEEAEASEEAGEFRVNTAWWLASLPFTSYTALDEVSGL